MLHKRIAKRFSNASSHPRHTLQYTENDIEFPTCTDTPISHIPAIRMKISSVIEVTRESTFFLPSANVYCIRRAYAYCMYARITICEFLKNLFTPIAYSYAPPSIFPHCAAKILTAVNLNRRCPRDKT
jgi:hypothetical protein